jgi:hypothetical protein
MMAALIKDPVFLLAYRAGVVGLLQVSRFRRPGLFDRLLALDGTHFIPTLSTAAGLNPHDRTLHHQRTRYLLPSCLVSLPLPAIARPDTDPVVVAAGGLGVALARVGAFPILRPGLPTQAPEAAGALAGTRIGGSANLVAAVTTLAFSPERPVAPARAGPAA